jgi:hypothetical protein
MLVNLHIIGVQKAGTTALASFLSQHPAIHLVQGKEAHVFDHPNYADSIDKQAFADNKYQPKLAQYQAQRLICDATPITIFNPQFLRDCYQYNPQAKFILVLRDPVDRSISHYHMTKNRKLEPYSMFWAFVLEPIRMLGIKRTRSWAFDSTYRNQSYLSRGRYSRQLTQLFAIIPAQQILVLSQRELKNRHQAVMLNIFEFLDIQRHDIKAEEVFNTAKLTKNKSDALAIYWAKFYFYIFRETPKHWQKIINKAQGHL